MQSRQRKEHWIEEEKRKAMRTALKSFYGRSSVTISIASPARGPRHDEAERDARSPRLLPFLRDDDTRKTNAERRMMMTRNRRRRMTTGSDSRRSVLPRSAFVIGAVAGCKWWDGRLMRLCRRRGNQTPTDPVSTSSPGIHASFVRSRTEITRCVGRRATTNIVIAIKSRRNLSVCRAIRSMNQVGWVTS